MHRASPWDELALMRGRLLRETLSRAFWRMNICSQLTICVIALQNYKAKYIDTNSLNPLFHVMWGTFIVMYLLGLPGVSFSLAKYMPTLGISWCAESPERSRRNFRFICQVCMPWYFAATALYCHPQSHYFKLTWRYVSSSPSDKRVVILTSDKISVACRNGDTWRQSRRPNWLEKGDIEDLPPEGVCALRNNLNIECGQCMDTNGRRLQLPALQPNQCSYIHARMW